jgi:hypothetical protein
MPESLLIYRNIGDFQIFRSNIGRTVGFAPADQLRRGLHSALRGLVRRIR